MNIIHPSPKVTPGVYFKTQLGESTFVPFHDFLISDIEHSSYVLISSVPLETSYENHFQVFMNETSASHILGLVLPFNLLDQVWRSTTTESLMIEVFYSIRRLGYDFERLEVPNSGSVKPKDQISGRWFSWRNFSKRAKLRVAGTADSGSVLADTLEVLSTSMPKYANWLVRKTTQDGSERILEIGAGTGTMTVLYASLTNVVAVEPSDSARAILRANTSALANVVVTENLSDAMSYGPYNRAVLINVLEHVEHDVQLLREIKSLLNPGGTLTVLSPAHNMLYSKFDASIGHVRRYTRASISSTLEMAGFTNVDSHYFNSIGAILWFIVNRLLSISSASSAQTSIYDRIIVPMSVIVDRLGIRAFGQSVIATGETK